MAVNNLNSALQSALAKAKGDRRRATKFLIEAAAQDAALAQQLAVPFLESIAGYAIDHFVRTNPDAMRATVAPAGPPRGESATQASSKHKAAMEALIGAYKKKE